MSGRFYDDLLSGVNRRMGIDYVAKDHLVNESEGYLHPSSGDPFKDRELKFQAAPKKGVNMEVKQTIEGEWKNDKRDVKEKTSSKITAGCSMCNIETTLANDKMLLDVSGEPIDNKDFPMNLAMKTEVKPAANAWKARLLYDVHTQDMSGTTLWQNIEVENNDKKEWLVSSKTNIAYEDQYHLGVHVQHDTVDFRKIRAQMVCDQKDNDSLYFLRVDGKRNFVGAGCDNKLKDGVKHSWEGIYCWNDNWKGVMGYPVKLMGGVDYVMGASSIAVQGEWWDRYVIKANATHKVDKNWTFGVNQRFDSSKIAKSQASPYDIGFSMTYKL